MAQPRSSEGNHEADCTLLHLELCTRQTVLTLHMTRSASLLLQGAGRVAAHGTPMELKAAHGEGYTLTLSLCSPPPPPTPSNSYNQLPAAAISGMPQAQSQQLQAALGGGAEGGAGRMEAMEALVQADGGIRDAGAGEVPESTYQGMEGKGMAQGGSASALRDYICSNNNDDMYHNDICGGAGGACAGEGREVVVCGGCLICTWRFREGRVEQRVQL
eukprot:1161645-Pelagomonas_calceolata.AAC.22